MTGKKYKAEEIRKSGVMCGQMPIFRFLAGRGKIEVDLKAETFSLAQKSGVFRRILTHFEQIRSDKGVEHEEEEEVPEFLEDPVEPKNRFRIIWNQSKTGEQEQMSCPYIVVSVEWIQQQEIKTVIRFLKGEPLKWTTLERSNWDFAGILLTLRHFAKSFEMPELFKEVSKILYVASYGDKKAGRKKVSNKDSILISNLTACTIFQDGAKFGLEHLKQPAFHYILKNAREILKDEKNYLVLNQTSLKEILSQSDLQVENEVKIFKALIRWGEGRCEIKKDWTASTKNLRSLLDELLPLVPSPQMRDAEFAENVYKTGILTYEQSFVLYQTLKNNKSLKHKPDTLIEMGDSNSRPAGAAADPKSWRKIHIMPRTGMSWWKTGTSSKFKEKKYLYLSLLLLSIVIISSISLVVYANVRGDDPETEIKVSAQLAGNNSRFIWTTSFPAGSCLNLQMSPDKDRILRIVTYDHCLKVFQHVDCEGPNDKVLPGQELGLEGHRHLTEVSSVSGCLFE